MRNPWATSAFNRMLSSRVYSHAKAGRFVLTLGGDHSIAIGTVAGTLRATKERLGSDVAVIWVDAHADINVPESSETGSIHGMPLAFLTGLASETEGRPFGWLSRETQRLAFDNIVYIGLRDVDRAEKQTLRENGIKAFSMHEIDRHGIGKVMDLALSSLRPDTPIHLSFDIDALDPLWAPSTSTAVRRGLTLREAHLIAECVYQTGNLIAMDLVEINPSIAREGVVETVRTGASIVRSALGESLL